MGILPPQSLRTLQARGVDLLTSPPALGLHYIDQQKSVIAGTLGKIIEIPVPADLPKRKFFLFIGANDETAGTRVVGVVKVIQNNSVITELPVFISQTGSGFSVAGSLQTAAPPVFENGLSFDNAGAINYTWPIDFTIQCDRFELWLSETTMPTPEAPIVCAMACLSQAIV